MNGVNPTTEVNFNPLGSPQKEKTRYFMTSSQKVGR